MSGSVQSPPYSSGSYNSVKTDVSMSVEDLSSGRAQIIDDDDDEHDDHDDSDKINDAEGMDPERLKAFNVGHMTSCRSGQILLNVSAGTFYDSSSEMYPTEAHRRPTGVLRVTL